MNARTIAARLRQGALWGLLPAAIMGGLVLGLGPHEGRSADAPLPPPGTSATGAAPPAATQAVAPATASIAVLPAASRAAVPSVGGPGFGIAASGALAATAASSAALRLSAQAGCVADVADPDGCNPLTLVRNPLPLPTADPGRVYVHVIRAEGGQPPYRFDLLGGSLPDGLTLDEHGRVTGTPGKPGHSRFRVRVVDAAGGVAAQGYTLRVGRPARPAAGPASPAAPASVPMLGPVDVSQAGPAANAAPTARIYRLDAAHLVALKAAVAASGAASDAGHLETITVDADGRPIAAGAAGPAASVPDLPPELAWSDAQQAQLEAILEPVIAVEYPSRSLFEAAVDAQVCNRAWQMIVHAAQGQHQPPPDVGEFKQRCAAPASASPAAVAAARSASSATAPPPVDWRDLPGWLMPHGLRDWLADAAAADRPLVPGNPLRWTATASCHCAQTNPDQVLYALYPTWLADGPQPQMLDFSLIDRITYFALPLTEDLGLDQPRYWTEARTAFIREARARDTHVDFGIYRADWGFLNTEPASAREEAIQRLTDQVPLHARELLDRELPGRLSHAKAWLPGFGEVQHMGDGLTVYFDQVPDAGHDAALAGRFADFYPRFVKGLAAAMNKNRARHYAINLVMTDTQVARAGPFEMPRLFELLKAVEDPEMVGGRIVVTNNDYKRNSNVELRFLVLLSEPTTSSKKALRVLSEAYPTIKGSDRRVFLRSIVPVLLLPQASPQQYGDDVVYMQDNFGGIGFWPAPLMGRQFDAAQATALRNTFIQSRRTAVGEAICDVVCPNRWPIRLAFELLLLAWIVWLALLQWRCDWRSRYGRYSLLGGIPPLLAAAALLQCDPALETLRQRNVPLIALVAMPVIAALWALLKRKENRP